MTKSYLLLKLLLTFPGFWNFSGVCSPNFNETKIMCLRRTYLLPTFPGFCNFYGIYVLSRLKRLVATYFFIHISSAFIIFFISLSLFAPCIAIIICSKLFLYPQQQKERILEGELRTEHDTSDPATHSICIAYCLTTPGPQSTIPIPKHEISMSNLTWQYSPSVIIIHLTLESIKNFHLTDYNSLGWGHTFSED